MSPLPALPVTIIMPQNNSGTMGTLTIPLHEGEPDDIYQIFLSKYEWTDNLGYLSLPIHIFIMNGSVTVNGKTYEHPIFMFDQTKFTIMSQESFEYNRDGFVTEFFLPYEGEIGGKRRFHKKHRTHKKRRVHHKKRRSTRK